LRHQGPHVMLSGERSPSCPRITPAWPRTPSCPRRTVAVESAYRTPINLSTSTITTTVTMSPTIPRTGSFLFMLVANVRDQSSTNMPSACSGSTKMAERWADHQSRRPVTGAGLWFSGLGRRSRTSRQSGAGEGNRTLVVSLGSFCSAIELHPHPELYHGPARAAYRRPRPSVQAFSGGPVGPNAAGSFGAAPR
jgi:hypothetical protein